VGHTVGVVVRVVSRLNMGGPARHTVLLDAGLRARGFETLLVHGSLAPGEASFESLADEAAVPAERVAALGRRIHFWDDARAFLAIWRIVRRTRPDVIHTHTAKAGALGRLAAALHNMFSPRRRQCVIVHTFHGHVFEGYFGGWQNRMVRLAERALATLTDWVIAISERQRDDLVTRFRVSSPSQTIVIPLGLRLDELFALPADKALRGAASGPPTAFNIGYVGRFVPIKDVATLIRAFAVARASLPSARLLLTGDGPDRESLAALARELGVADAVTFRGWQRDLAATYAPLDVLVLTSKNEGTPVAIIEAMAAGVPVVAPPVGGIPDLITHDVTGLLAERSPDAIAAAIVRTAIGFTDAASRAQRARDLVRARHSESALIDRIAALYERSIAQKRGGQPVESA
jgi:glycosyltransferase involved in cell wall biosynthesis